MTDIRETVAKALCAADGYSPDARDNGKRKLWRGYEPDAIAALQAIESNGFAIVPVEPNEAMQAAALRSFVGGHTSPAEIHKAMLTAYKEGK